MRKLANRFEPMLFSFVLSGLMSCLVAGIATLRTVGWVAGFAQIWAGAWLAAWLVAFPIVLFAAPLTRRLVQRLVAEM